MRVPADHATIQAAIDNAQPGDVIEIAPGNYAETVLLTTPDITLRGEAAKTCVVSPACRDGIPLTIEQATGVSLSNLTFSHRDTADLDYAREEWPDGLLVTGGQVTIKSCGFGPTAGCGLASESGAIVSMRDCDASDNPQAGVYVVDPGTKVTVEATTARGNDYGFRVFGDATLKLQGVRAENSYSYGAVGEGSDSRIEIRNSHFVNTTGQGIVIANGCQALLEGNESRGNGGHGIQGISGANVEAKGNQCLINRGRGISMEGANHVGLYNNRCVGNGTSGIGCAMLEARAVVVGNHCERNSRAGLHFYEAVEAEVRDNICIENEVGVLATEGCALGDLTGNPCSGNREDAVSWLPQGTIDQDDPAYGNLYGWLLYREDLDKLEARAEYLRASGARDDQGRSHLFRFYDVLREGFQDKTPCDEGAWRALMDRWRRAYPESTTPLVLLAHGAELRAWNALGNGAPEAEERKAFLDGIAEMRGILEEAAELNAGDPEVFRLLLNVAGEERWPEDRIRAACAEGLRITPTYDELLDSAVACYRSDVSEDTKASARLAEWVCKELRNSRGLAPYAMMASYTLCQEYSDDYLQHHSFEWPLLAEGFPRLLEEAPASTLYLNAYCKTACLHDQRDIARDLFQRIGTNEHEQIWDNDEFAEWKTWANGGTLGVLDTVPEEGRPYLYIMFGLGAAFVAINGALLAVFLVYTAGRRRPPRPPVSL